MNDSVSIIVPCARDVVGAQALALSAVETLNQENILELILVVNGEGNLHRLRAFEAAVLGIHDKIKVLYEPVGSSMAARHRGALESRGSVLSFIDDDVTLAETWGSAILSAFSDPEVSLVGGPSLPRWQSEPPAWIWKLSETRTPGRVIMPFLSLLDLGNSRISPINPNLIWSLNLSIRRNTFFDLGGFHPCVLPQRERMYLGDGETGLTRKFAQAGYRAVYEPSASVRHFIASDRLTRKALRDRAFVEGISLEFTRLRRLKPTSASEGLMLLRQRDLKASTFSSELITVIKLVLAALIATLAPASVNAQKRLSITKGRRFLQKHFRKDPAVRRWIFKPNYWGWDHRSSAKDGEYEASKREQLRTDLPARNSPRLSYSDDKP